MSIFSNYFLILLYYSYETRLQIFERLRPVVVEMLFLVRYELSKHCRSEFLSVFSNSFIILFYYSYEMHLQNFKMLRPVVVEIYYLW